MRPLADRAVTSAWAGRRVAVIATFDSFLKAAVPYARYFESRGAHVRHTLLFAREGQISRAQSQGIGVPFHALDVQPLERLATREALECEDVLLLAADGQRTRRFLVRFHDAFRGARQRPLVVVFYPGLIFRFHFEGMTSRMGADALCLSSLHDLSLYESALEALGLENTNALALGLASIPSAEEREKHVVRRDGPVLFAGQPTVPAGEAERRYVVEQLVGLAERHPDVRWQLKPRLRRGETTLHRVDHHYEDLLEALVSRSSRRVHGRRVPSNLEVTHRPIDALLRECRACLTFSSTAALEAVALGVPTRVLTDVGLHENIGNQFFLGSGLHGALADLDPHDLPFRVDDAWRDRHLRSARDHFGELDARLEALLATQAERGRALLPPHPSLFGRVSAYEAHLASVSSIARAELGQRTPRPSTLRALGRRLAHLGRRIRFAVRRGPAKDERCSTSTPAA